MASICGRVSFECDSCGCAEFSVPGNATETSEIICDGCGESVGTVAHVNEQISQVGRSIAAELQEHLRRNLKASKRASSS